MAFKIKGEIRGLADLIRKLDVLKPALAKKYLRKAMRTATSIANKAAKTNVATGPDATGQTKRSLGTKVKVYPSVVVVGVVEPRAGFTAVRPGGQTHDPRKTAHLLERGTKLRRTKAGANRGAMPARPFLLPAFTANEGRIVQVFEAVIDEALATL
jgi:HK97 gp10 family phage protein